MSFTLDKFTTVLVKSVNIRAEVHGKEKVPAADIGLRLTCSNSVLTMFDAGLLVGLYKPASEEEDDDQPDLDGVDPPAERPVLRCPSIAMPIDLNREYVGRNVVIDYGLGGASNIELTTCTVGAFKVDAKEGGTVEINFRVQVSGIDKEALGVLGCLVKHDVQITLMSSPQADNTQEQLPQAGVNPFKLSVVDGKIVDNNPTEPDATDMFLGEHAGDEDSGEAGEEAGPQ